MSGSTTPRLVVRESHDDQDQPSSPTNPDQTRKELRAGKEARGSGGKMVGELCLSSSGETPGTFARSTHAFKATLVTYISRQHLHH